MGHRGGHSQAAGRGGGREQGTTVQTDSQCTHCGRRHPGECRLLTGACLKYGEHGHFLRDCPYRREVSTAVSEPSMQR